MFVRRTFFGKAFKVITGLFVGHKVVQPAAAATQPEPTVLVVKDTYPKHQTEIIARENAILRKGLDRLEAALDGRISTDPRIDISLPFGWVPIERRLGVLEERMRRLHYWNRNISAKLDEAHKAGFPY